MTPEVEVAWQKVSRHDGPERWRAFRLFENPSWAKTRWRRTDEDSGAITAYGLCMARVLSVLAVILMPLVWPIGVTLLWLSPAWSARAKSIGTFVMPGGLALAVFLELGDRSSCTLDSATACVIGPTYRLLHPASAGFNHVFGALVFTTAVVLPLAASVYLAITLRRKWSDV